MVATFTTDTNPIAGLWVLDNGMEFRHFMTTPALAQSISNGYGIEMDAKYRTRPASLQWFGKDGYCEATVFINTPLPTDLADDTAKEEVFDAWARSRKPGATPADKAGWNAFRRQANKQKQEFRQELARKIDIHRAENLQPVAR